MPHAIRLSKIAGKIELISLFGETRISFKDWLKKRIYFNTNWSNRGKDLTVYELLNKVTYSDGGAHYKEKDERYMRAKEAQLDNDPMIAHYVYRLGKEVQMSIRSQILDS